MVAKKKNQHNQQRMDRIHHFQRGSSQVHSTNWLSTYCLHAMSDGLIWLIWLLILLRHFKTWCAWCSSEPGDGFFNNRASTFSCNSKLCSRDSYGLKTCPGTRLLTCTCILVIAIYRTRLWIWIIPLRHSCLLIWQCVCWTHLLLWAFDSSYVFFFSASFFFALIASTWHRRPEHFKLAEKCLSIWAFQDSDIDNLITRVLATCSLHCWVWIDRISIRKFRLIVDVLAILAGAPRSSMQLYATGEWPAVGSFEPSALHVWQRVLCPSRTRLRSNVLK